jgi:cell division protein ZapA
MAQVVVQVNDRPYTMQCPDGEEEHLKELARLLDAEVVRIRQSVGTVGDIRLLVMSGLMVADRLSEAIRKIEDREDRVRGLREARAAAQSELKAVEETLSERLDIAAKRLEAVVHEIGRQ